MKASDLMTRSVQQCSKHDSLEQAARTMWEADVGCLIVTDSEQKPIGVITDRDIAMAAYTQGVRLREAAVAGAMAHAVKTCSLDSSLSEAEEVMRREQIRRLPVVDASGKLAGILTLGDIVKSSQSSALRATEIPGVVKTLSAIIRPRSMPAAAE